MARDFDLHEDEWGMISLEPIENLANRAEVVAQAAAHGEAHRAPDGVGWTALFVAPASPTSISVRAITLEALAAVLGPAFTPSEKVTTGYSSLVAEVKQGFAFLGPDDEVLYGAVADGVISDLNVLEPTLKTMSALGTEFRLMICDLWCDAAIDLCDREELDRYLAFKGE